MDLLSRVLYRDGLVVIINKPPGIPVHTGPSGKRSLENDFDQLRFGLPRLPALAHRLDADTSGCLVLGRHPKALRRLGRIFSQGLAQKTYLAVVHGVPESPTGRIDTPLLKISSRKEGWRIVCDPDGKPSITDYTLVASSGTLSLLQLFPRTGRTHQIRVHLAHEGYPILGDPLYGHSDEDGKKTTLHLHAHRIKLPLYQKKPVIDVTAPLPSAFNRTLDTHALKPKTER